MKYYLVFITILFNLLLINGQDRTINIENLVNISKQSITIKSKIKNYNVKITNQYQHENNKKLSIQCIIGDHIDPQWKTLNLYRGSNYIIC